MCNFFFLLVRVKVGLCPNLRNKYPFLDLAVITSWTLLFFFSNNLRLLFLLTYIVCLYVGVYMSASGGLKHWAPKSWSYRWLGATWHGFWDLTLVPYKSHKCFQHVIHFPTLHWLWKPFSFLSHLLFLTYFLLSFLSSLSFLFLHLNRKNNDSSLPDLPKHLHP